MSKLSSRKAVAVVVDASPNSRLRYCPTFSDALRVMRKRKGRPGLRVLLNTDNGDVITISEEALELMAKWMKR